MNNQRTYTALQTACPHENEKPFEPILAISPIMSERRETVKKWNDSLHFMLDRLQSATSKLNISFTKHITASICSNPKYAVKSNRCTQIDQHTPG